MDDFWLMKAIKADRKSVLPAHHTESSFVMEREWSDRPMAYHPPSGSLADIDHWNNEGYRNAIYGHCPEIKTILNMKTTWEKCPPGNTTGKALGRPGG